MSSLYEQLKTEDLFAKGYDAWGQSQINFSGSEVNKKSQLLLESGVPSNFIQDGETIVRLDIVDGYLQSANFVTGVSGWRIDAEGNVEFADGTFRGKIEIMEGTDVVILLDPNG